MERALEGDHGRPAGEEPGELDRVLDGLGAGVEERRLRRTGERRARNQLLGELDVGLVGDDREIGVGEAAELLLRRLDDAGMRMAGVQAADPAGEVDEDVAVDVGQRRAPALVRHEREHDRLRVRDHRLLPLEDRLRPRPRDGRSQLYRASSSPRAQDSSGAGSLHT